MQAEWIQQDKAEKIRKKFAAGLLKIQGFSPRPAEMPTELLGSAKMDAPELKLCSIVTQKDEEWLHFPIASFQAWNGHQLYGREFKELLGEAHTHSVQVCRGGLKQLSSDAS